VKPCSLGTHPCPSCGQSTAGTYSEGGVRWAICQACMDRELAAARRELEALERELGLSKEVTS